MFSELAGKMHIGQTSQSVRLEFRLQPVFGLMADPKLNSKPCLN